MKGELSGIQVRMSETDDRELLYVGDPMCSWCWGISPQLDRLLEELPGMSFRILAGGLRAGPAAQQLSDEFVEFLAVEWSQVNAHTRQPFDFGILQREDWVYDTEPACRAVTVMGEIDESLAWPLFKRIQHAFYAEGVVVTDPEVYPGLVSDVGGDPDKFMAMFRSQEARPGVAGLRHRALVGRHELPDRDLPPGRLRHDNRPGLRNRRVDEADRRRAFLADVPPAEPRYRRLRSRAVPPGSEGALTEPNG